MKSIALLGGFAIGGFTVLRISMPYKFEVGQYVGVEHSDGAYYSNGYVQDRKRGIFSDSYLVDDGTMLAWYNQSQLSEYPYT